MHIYVKILDLSYNLDVLGTSLQHTNQRLELPLFQTQN
jgi:hypothetical protein